MRLGLFAIISILAAALPAAADEHFTTLTVGANQYSDVTVTLVTTTDIYFAYDGGMANAKLKDLSPELQKHFRYDAASATAAQQKQKQANSQYYVEVASQPAVHPPDETRYPSSPSPPEPQTGKKLWAKSFLNQKAPDLVVEKWLTPEPDLRGKFILIDFWATWCPPCRKAIPELNDYAKEFGDKLVVIGISDEPENVVKNFNNPRIEYSVAIDTQARMKKAVGVTGIPHVLILDPKGIVRWEGYPFLEGYELNDKVIAEIITKYSN